MFGITPDMTTFAKAAGGGYQMAGFGGKAEIAPPENKEDGKWYAFHGDTYDGHPGSAATGLKTPEILDERDVYERIDETGDRLFRGTGRTTGTNRMDREVQTDRPTNELRPSSKDHE